METYLYCVNKDAPEEATQIKSTWNREHANYIAEDAAAHYYANFEEYPKVQDVFCIYDAEGIPLGKFKVRVDLDPVFRASKVEY